ncbi:bifunctional (p)ppGpp synthetase/guanosine-3',5'-bis(diphosphate) 3'-pyrophosphohydrolase [Actinomadura barringtoniae]|uniref:Bifunctional (P)ppGpp synthetase/guanosine-3',5'-bis(Diphosphate) 3'-pyrophosphohydrolase n=1 Tax=Actinomadura barringtoniae TaxID=1427535 RepID=A0A939PK91_9ACTN|nr:HD domain-containing protein [Actinomadura barringtoniae]MBO2453842.1 bifunctional (p)ppGpp synthetase/guanosine-3',5'-bis(diphosphate) 3'-pyrophosphohydrolase [Actinomadura barringtoniae]
MTTLNPAGSPGAARRSPLDLLRRREAARAAARDPVRSAVAPLLVAHRAACPAGDESELLRGYEVAERLHRGQLRKSGAPYITHPLAVAMILAGMGMDTTTLVAALLHDTVEDTPYTLGEVRADFGEEVAVLVDGVTKLDGERWGERAEAETFRKIVLAAAADLRVLVIKLADRLHNLRTLRYQPPHKRARYATASLELLVPFAERLGIHVLKREMDDLAFAARAPEEHAFAEAAVRVALRGTGTALGPALTRLRSALGEQRVGGRLEIRPRHLYAVHQERGGDLAGLRPCEAARLLLLIDGDDQDCYVALGAVHAALHPIPGHVKDFIALPKFNMYQSLHTRVISPDGDPLDVIIRNRAMHPVAEYGIVAHIRDAGNGVATADAVAGRRDLVWLSRLLAWQSDVPSAEFLAGLRADLASGNVAVFTTAGEIVMLPAGATALDFAYALAAETGGRSIGALVNGRLAPLSAEVRSGNVVEILTDPDGAPSEDWLAFAVTAPARVHIQQWIADRRAEENATAGRTRLVRALAGKRVDLLTAEAHGDSLAVARDLGYAEIDHMYAALSTGALTLDTLLSRFDPA